MGTDYDDLVLQLTGVLAGEADVTANLANAAAVIFHGVPGLNWAGFYLLQGDVLVLGPFQGRVACTRIPVGQGVCGAAAATRATQRVDDVHAFSGHIACDSASQSELVMPLIADGRLLGVLDLDAPVLARFSAADAAGCERLAGLIAAMLAQ